MDLDPTLWDISKHEMYINTAEFSFTCKEAQRWKRRCSFPSTCHAEVPGKTLFYPTTKWQSQRLPRNSTLPREQPSPTPGRARPEGQARPAKSRGPQQGAGIPQFTDGERKLPRGAGSKNPVLGGKKVERTAMAAELRWRASETPTQAVRRNAGVCLTGNIQDPTRLTWSKAPFQQEIGPGEANLDVSMIPSLCLSFQRSDRDSAVPAQQRSQAPVHLQPCSSFQSNIGRLQINHMLWSFSSLGVTQIILGSVQTAFGFFQAFTHEHSFHSLCMLILAKQLQTLKRQSLNTKQQLALVWQFLPCHSQHTKNFIFLQITVFYMNACSKSPIKQITNKYLADEPERPFTITFHLKFWIWRLCYCNSEERYISTLCVP